MYRHRVKQPVPPARPRRPLRGQAIQPLNIHVVVGSSTHAIVSSNLHYARSTYPIFVKVVHDILPYGTTGLLFAESRHAGITKTPIRPSNNALKIYIWPNFGDSVTQWFTWYNSQQTLVVRFRSVLKMDHGFLLQYTRPEIHFVYDNDKRQNISRVSHTLSPAPPVRQRLQMCAASK